MKEKSKMRILTVLVIVFLASTLAWAHGGGGGGGKEGKESDRGKNELAWSVKTPSGIVQTFILINGTSYPNRFDSKPECDGIAGLLNKKTPGYVCIRVN